MFKRLALMLILFALSTPTLEAQCGFFCPIKLTPVVTLGDAGAGTVGPISTITNIGSEYFVAHQYSRDEIQVFDHEGAFSRILGREGEGPGEYRRIVDLNADAYGVLWVLDGTNMRVSAIDTHEGEVTGTELVPYGILPSGMKVLPNGDYLLGARIPTKENIGKWTHLVRPGEGIVWSAEDDDQDVFNSDWRQRWFAPDSAGFWVVWGKQAYQMEYRDYTEGRIQRVLRPERKWWTNEQVLIAGKGGETGVWAPQSMVMGAHLEDGVLWTLIITAGTDARRSWLGGKIDPSKYQDQYIEAFDAGTGELLESEKMDLDGGTIMGFSDQGLVMVYDVVGEVPHITLYRLGLK